MNALPLLLVGGAALLLMGRKKNGAALKTLPAPPEPPPTDPLEGLDSGLATEIATELDAFSIGPLDVLIPTVVKRVQVRGPNNELYIFQITKLAGLYFIDVWDGDKWWASYTAPRQQAFGSVAEAEQYANNYFFGATPDPPPSKVPALTTSPYNKTMFPDLDAVKNVLAAVRRGNELAYQDALGGRRALKRAVKRFQNDWNNFANLEGDIARLKADGLPGVQTLRALEWVSSNTELAGNFYIHFA